ncbi:MAG: hypothetical protein COB35_08120 [Gammaproteobacteria bacterium]|nr:MAG: hypothetical protein COB35_08120 [Gammaproteobacteria bacterium]
MAIINCPSCGKKVSDQAINCSHCQLDLKNADADQIQHLNKISKINKSQSLMNHSFIAMILFCGGVLMLFWRSSDPLSLEYKASVAATVIGFVLYIVTRIRLFLLKFKK